MSNGLDFEKILLIGLIAVVLLGPDRLPTYAASLARFTRRAKDWVDGARVRVREEMGDEFDDIEWRKLDPRQYDPRRIIREALIEDAPVPPAPAVAAAAAVPAAAVPVAAAVSRREPGAPVPFDTEAT